MKTIAASCAVIAVALVTMAFINYDTKKVKLKGTQWINVFEFKVLDAGKRKIEKIIHFTTKKNAVITTKYSTSAYNRPFMNPDGTVTVDRVEATSSESTENVTYKVSGKTVTITYADGSKCEYSYHEDFLLFESGYSQDKIFNRYNP